jgi:hypothetical protein
MLFSKPISDLTFEDVEEFCKRFKENMRVEYKSTFDDSVKKKLPKVLSSFANSYGGILIIGINAPAGAPQEPFEGIVFPEREPGLTVQSLCRDNIFPEIPLYTGFVSSRTPDKAYLVVQVNESPKAPHAIENSTQVHVRAEGGTERTSLADIALIERMLLRRRDVLGRWEEFYTESENLAKAVGFGLDAPRLELRIGPQYPAEAVIAREKVSEFLGEHNRRYRAGFLQQEVLRHPAGAFLSRQDDMVRYLNIGEIGTVHYLEPLDLRRENENDPVVTNLWWTASYILMVISVVADLMTTHGISCGLRVEASLVNIARLPFYTHTTRLLGYPEVHAAAFPLIPASLIHPSESLSERAADVTTEILYQLRWPLGGSSGSREAIRNIVAQNRGA